MKNYILLSQLNNIVRVHNIRAISESNAHLFVKTILNRNHKFDYQDIHVSTMHKTSNVEVAMQLYTKLQNTKKAGRLIPA